MLTRPKYSEWEQLNKDENKNKTKNHEIENSELIKFNI